jgi:gas vesicle protein
MAQLADIRSKISEVGEQIGERTTTLLREMQTKNILMIFLTAFCSFALGLIIGLLTAPYPGQETRSRVKETVSKATGRVTRFRQPPEVKASEELKRETG